VWVTPEFQKRRESLGSARDSRAGFGDSPKGTFVRDLRFVNCHHAVGFTDLMSKVRTDPNLQFLHHVYELRRSHVNIPSYASVILTADEIVDAISSLAAVVISANT